jgi:TPP-dependent pyruvate/acetoin dehydrogenase alpha subunit
MYDPQLYREKAEVERWMERDPITTFAARLRAAGVLDDAAIARLEAEVTREITDAVAFAEAGTPEPVDELERFVLAEERAG